MHERVVIQEVDRTLGERARDLVWNDKLRPKDAIHVATALDAKVDHFDTYDRGLIDLSGVLGNPTLAIGNPNIPETLFDPGGVEPPSR